MIWLIVAVTVVLALGITLLLVKMHGAWRKRDTEVPQMEPPNVEPPEYEPPEINLPEFGQANTPPTFLDPLSMEPLGEQVESVTIATPTGFAASLLVNAETARLFRERGLRPFALQMLGMMSSTAYCHCGEPCVASNRMYEQISLPYLFIALFGEYADGEDEGYYLATHDYWCEHAADYGCKPPEDRD